MNRIIKGCWQFAEGHGKRISEKDAIADLCEFPTLGITIFDCADIYTGVEELLGNFLLEHYYGPGHGRERAVIRVHTKFVPDIEVLSRINRRYVEEIIDRSLDRLGMHTLDLVQFHWWDFDVPGYIKVLKLLATGLKRDVRVVQAFGICNTHHGVPRINETGVTNFDVQHLEEVLAAGVPIVTNQVQYSLLDRRPEHGMGEFARKHRIKLLCYGTLAGGFFSENWLGQPEPLHLQNRSLVKYKLIIDDFGGWSIFQKLLLVLRQVARKHDVTIPDVAVRFVLDKPGVAAVILGGSAKQLYGIDEAIDFQLDRQDKREIKSILDQARDLPGDIYNLERIKGGKHAAIMRYNLNERK